MRPVTSALLLDVDDTLIDTRAAMVAAGAAAVAELWPEAGAEVHHAAGVHFHRDPSGFFGRFATGELGFAQMREARVADLLEAFSFTAIDEVNRRFEEAYAPAFSANVRLFDDVLPFVEAATTAGIPMGLLTNSASYYTQQKLEITGLEGVFAVVVTRDTLGFGKPDPRAFHHACELLGERRPRRCTSVTTSRSTRSQPRTPDCMPSGCSATGATAPTCGWPGHTAYRWSRPSRTWWRCCAG